MAKFHVTKAGRTEPCGATVKTCPLGGEEAHYNSATDAARANIEKGFAESLDHLAGLHKKLEVINREKEELNERSAMLRERTSMLKLQASPEMSEYRKRVDGLTDQRLFGALEGHTRSIEDLEADASFSPEAAAKAAERLPLARAKKKMVQEEIAKRSTATIDSFTKDSSFFSEYGYMNQDDATEVAQILWHREHSTPLNMFQEGALAQALRAHTAQEWSYDPSDAGRREAWRQHLRENLPVTMLALES